ncbi:MAG: VTT domain-containing protein [Planctomycetota bacterium]|nr:VTT domain-containing protein [Planctomycetaceae bacterium]MDQ3331117.1 VTT domain-containing protein [Planctomycetota bacterium]
MAALFLTIAFIGWKYSDLLSLKTLAAREAELLDFGRRHTVFVLAGLFAIYVGVTASSLPAATALTFLAAWLFQRLFGAIPGFVGAVALVSFASTTGATIAFLISRHLLGTAIRSRYSDAIAKFDEAIRRDGSYYLFTLRLTPVVPFWLVNLAMSLTPLRTRTFWWISQLGMLPGTLVFVFAGSQVPSLTELEGRGVWDLLWPGPLIALLLLAAFPWIVRSITQRLKPTSADRPETVASWLALFVVQVQYVLNFNG